MSSKSKWRCVSFVLVTLLATSFVVFCVPLFQQANGTTYVNNGLESLDAWTTNAGNLDTIAVTSGYAIYGTKSLNLSAANGYGYKYGGVYINGLSLSTAYARIYTNVSLLNINNGNYTTLWSLRTGTASQQLIVAVEIVYNGSMNVWQMGYYASSTLSHVPTTIPFLGNTTNYCELRGTTSTTVGEVQMYVNGVLAANVTGLNTGSTAINMIYVGGVYGADMTYYSDAVEVADAYIGEETPDLTAPTYGNPDSSTTAAGNTCQFTLDVDDNEALATAGEYEFGWNGTGSWEWDAAVAFSSTPQTITVSKTLPAVVGTVVGWKINFTDNAGNSNNTGIQSLTTTEFSEYPASASMFGKTTSGAAAWYVPQTPNNTFATQFNLLEGATFNAMFCRAYCWGGSTNVTVRLAVFNGTVQAITNNITIPFSQTTPKFFLGLFAAGNVSLSPGNYSLALIQANGPLGFCYDNCWPVQSWQGVENINLPSGNVPALELAKQFDIFCAFLGASTPPSAVIRYSFANTPTTTEVGNRIDFDPSSSIGGFDGTSLTDIANYTWNFGDGSTNMSVLPTVVGHTYNTVGDYLVSLNVTDTAGNSNVASSTFFIKPAVGYPNFTISDYSDTAAFAVGLQHSGNYKYWDRENFFWTASTHNYTLDTEVTFMGNPTAKLEMLNPQPDVWGTNRMQIYKDLDTSATYVTQVLDFKLPANLPSNQSDGQRFWYGLMDGVAERHYNNSLLRTAQQFGILFGCLWSNGYSVSNGTYEFMWDIHNIPTIVDNDNNNVLDDVEAAGNFSSFQYLWGADSGHPVQLDTWLRATLIIYRNPDYRTDPTGGNVYLKIENQTELGVVDETLLEVNLADVRTVGIWPENLDSDDPWGSPNQNSNYMTLFDAGYSLYYGGMDDTKTNYFGVPTYFHIGAYSINQTVPDVVVPGATPTPGTGPGTPPTATPQPSPTANPNTWNAGVNFGTINLGRYPQGTQETLLINVTHTESVLKVTQLKFPQPLDTWLSAQDSYPVTFNSDYGQLTFELNVPADANTGDYTGIAYLYSTNDAGIQLQASATVTLTVTDQNGSTGGVGLNPLIYVVIAVVVVVAVAAVATSKRS